MTAKPNLKLNQFIAYRARLISEFKCDNDLEGEDNEDNPLYQYLKTFEDNHDDFEDILLHLQYLAKTQVLISNIAKEYQKLML